MTFRSLGHRAPLLWVLLPMMAGLVAGKLQWLPLPSSGLAVVAVLAAGTALAWRRAWVPGLVAGVFLGGAAFYELRRDRPSADWEVLPPREARVTVIVDRLFSPRPDGRSASGLGRIMATDAHLAELVGQPTYFTLSLAPAMEPPSRGSRVELTGVLQSLARNPPGDTFDAYLAAQGMNFKLTRARVTGGMTSGNAYQVFRDTALRRFNAILGHGIEAHPRYVAVLRAMLLGKQHELSEEQKTAFRESGTMHLFSISGLHIAVIAGVIHGILLVLRLPDLARFLFGGVLLWLYVDITGGTPSAVRAFLMVMFLHASFVLKRPGNPVSALVASAVCVLLVQPMQLFTASFQLSYGIVASLLLLGLPLGERLNEACALFTALPQVAWQWRHRWIDYAWRRSLDMIAIGLSTSVVSTVCGVLIFQLFTPVSLIANLVLIPAGSLVIICGFITLLCGLVGLNAPALLLNHASALLLLVIEHGVDFFNALPGASHEASFLNAVVGHLALVGLLAVVLFGYSSNWEPKRGGYWTPFVFTALALFAGMRLIASPAG